jgi:glycosyltransferase involved in cell wall biosynthesis
MNKLVSVVIPVYNTSKYLYDCVNSVLAQSYSNIEIILVDDGSTDISPKICDEFSRQDSRIYVIHKNNGGLSDARNIGLQHAHGEYLLFLDSDDFWRNSNDLENLLNNAYIEDPNFVFLEFNRSRYIPSNNKFVDNAPFPLELKYKTSTDQVCVNLINEGLFPMSACTKLINRKFLVENEIKFKKGIFSEDIPWFLEILNNCNTGMYYTNQYMYGNRAEVMTSLTSTFSEKKFNDVIDIINDWVPKINGFSLKSDAKSCIYSFFAYRYIILLTQSYKYRNQLSDESLCKLSKLKWLLKYDCHPKVRKTKILFKFLGEKLSLAVLNLYLSKRDSIKAIL